MPTYDVDVGGKTYEVDAPDPDTAWQWANSYANEQASAQPAPTPTGERTWGETVTDVGAGLVQGAGSLVSLPGQLYGLATGNFSPTGSLGLGQSISEAGEGMKSEGLKFREAESARAVEEAEKNGQLSAFATRFIETVTDPAQLTNFLATVVPQLILPAGAAKVVAGKVFASTLEKGMAAGLSQAAAKEAAQKAAISYGTAAAKGAGATMQGAEVGTSSYEDIYKKLIEQGASETEAADQAIGLARSAGAGAGVVSFLAQSLPGASALEAKFAGKAGAGRIATGVKEAGSEMLEEAPGQAIQNLAMQQVDPTQSLMEGVGASAAQALIGGLGAGLALGAGPNAAEQEQTKLKAEQAAFEEERRSEIKRLQEDRDRAREGLGLNEDRPLALPAPALEADVEAEDRELVNPVGNIPKEELSPEVVEYIDTYRKENNLPRLNSYSIEDVRDAMTQVNPEGEQGALDSILAAKTGYTGEERYVADDVLNAATEKNVATDTQGFNDFLERTTGRNTLDGMSQPQLYSAFKALKDMKRDDTTEQLVLPEGTNAARFTTKQYNNAVKLANMAIEESGGTLGIDSLVTEIKEATNLETDRDALSILEAAIKNEDLNESRKPVYRTYKPDSTTPVATYDTSDKADTAAKKQGLNVQKETLRQITPKAKTAPKIRPSGLPAGYEITESTLAETDVPAAYGISVEGEGKPLSTVKTEAEAPAKVARLQALRAKRADQMSANIDKANSAIDRGQANLDRLEADGKGGTEVYQKQQAKQASRVKTLGNRIKLFEDQRVKFLAPLQVKPMGKRTPTRSSYTVKKDGQSIGSFPTQQAAEESVISQLADAELEALSAGEVSRVSNRAAVELETRKSGRTGIPVKGTKERLEKAGVETADFQEKVKALKEQLAPMLAKFGLKDVALKIVRQVEDGKADGSYSGLDNLIEIAMSADKPIRTMRHEVIHALRRLGFFTPQQWGALQRQAKQTWIPKYLAGRTAEIDGKIMTRLEAYQQMGLSEIDIIEEAIADAFADFDVSGQAPAGLMQSLLKRLQNFFKALRAAFGGAGFESAEEIFGKIEVGALVPRESKIARSGGIKRSLATPATTDEDGVSPDSPSESKASPAAKAVNDGPYSDAAIRAINSKGSDSSNKLEVDEVGELFDKAYLKEFGVKGSWQVPADFKRAVSQAVIELKHQMQQAKSGLDWYEQDIADAFKATEKYIPSLSKPEKRALFSVIAGIMSPSTNARDNWFIAAQAYQHYEKTGILPGNNPATGGLWMGGLESANKKKQLDMLNAMLQPKSRGGLGEKAAIEWLRGDHTVAEITNFRKQYGNMGKSSAGGKAIDIVPGFTAFGPKVGPFVMNINGLHEVTVDVWMTRTFNRYFGQMMGPDGKMLRAPTEPQRVAVKNLATEAAKQLGIKPYQVQSVLWFFEQNLFNKLGTGAKSYAFSDGATKFAESQGGTGTAKGAAANVGANATARGATGKQTVGTGVQASKPSTRAGQQAAQQGIKDDNKYSIPVGKFTLRPSARSGEILKGSGIDGRSFVAPAGLGKTLAEHDVRRDREVGKRPNVEGYLGTGREFTGFFSNISLGFKGKPNAKPYEPTLNVEPIADFVREYNSHRGSFDDHIATSIPGFREVQTIVGEAIAKTYKNADMLDIGASEGALVKAVTKMSNGGVRTVALDPNFAMAKHFNDGESVEGSVYDTSAFGTKADEGQLAWTEDATLIDRDGQVTTNPFAGEEVRTFKPDRQFDVIHEAMVFQFISGNRAAQIARAKELMKPDGVLIIEEKFVAGDQLSPEQFRANEAQKDTYKEQYFTKSEIAAKAKAVGVAEKAEFKEKQDKKEQTVTGMNDLMVSPGGIEDVLSSNFDHVAQFWDSGNFKGYIASDSSIALENLVNNMLPTDSEFANVKTPRVVKYSITPSDKAIVLGKLQPDAVEFPGVHYGNVQTDQLQASKYGTGMRGSERRRLQNTDDQRIKNRVYFYIKKPDGTMPNREAGVGNYVYTQKFKNILGPGKTMNQLFSKAKGESNDFESNVVDAGYDGYAVPSMGMMVILNHDVPVNYEGTNAEFDAKKPKLSLKTHFSTPEAAERAAYKKAAPVTKAFKQWFGGSSVVEEGRPKVMFHASPNEFEQFSTFKPIFVSEDASSSEYFASLKRLGKKSGRNYIYPLWVRAETPWDFENKEHVQQVVDYLNNEFDSYGRGKGKYLTGDLSLGRWNAIESQDVQQALKALGFDSFYVKEGELKNLAVFGANQVKSITGNEGDFSLELKNMRFSLRTSDEPMTKDNVVAAMEFAQTKQPYTNCKLCTQLATGVPDLLSLPKVQQAKIGDIYTFNEKKNMASHYAVDVGNGDAVEVEGWGERVRVVPLSDITAEYDQPSAIRRPPVSAYTAEKYSLPFVSSQADARVNATTQPRENEGWVTRLMNITSPESRSNLRAGLINRYNQLSIYDRMLAEKMGGVELMADQRSESAALFSDLSAGVVASALGVGARRGGVPIYKGGFTTVDTSTKGLIEIFSPLALYSDPKVYQYYQYWSAVKRGTRLLSEGRERLIEEGDRVYAAELQKQFPEFVSVQKDFNEFNNGLMAYAVATDVISKEAAAEYTKYADYVPFFRQLNGEQTVGPRVFNAISGVKPPRKLKGGEAPLSDFLENSVRNVQAIVNAGMKNSAGIKAVDVAMQLGTDVGAEELSQQSSAPNTVTVLKKGKPVSYQVGDQLFIDAVKSLNMTEIPFIGVLSKPSEVLRNLVTRDPGFMFANLLRDSLSAYVTSGVSMTPVVGTMTSFAKALAGKNRSMEDLFNAGIIGGYEFSANVEASGERLGKDLQRKYGSKTVSEKVLRPFTWLWDGLEKGTTASDAATRTLVYDRVLAETGNEMEALSRSLEVMNFNRRGSSTLIRILTASVPFLNARIQGLDLFYRASSGAMNTNDAKQIQKAFWVRGLTMMALSAMYFMAVSGDDEYKKQEQETKDNNWIVPYLNIKLPIPFEVGTLFKTVPERIIALAFGEDTSGDFFKSMQGALLNTFAFNPVPQAIKPLLEARVNYNFFTTRPLISQGMEDVAPEYQYTPGTSEVAKWLGKQIGVSPIKIDHVVRGYTGTLGGYAVSLTDAALETVGASTKASKTFVQLPLVKRFALDPDARGKVSDFYEIKNSVDQFVRTSNLLEKTMQPEEFKKFVSKNKGLYAVKDYVRDIEKSMKEMREMRTTVQNLNISPDSKRDLLVNIGKRENNLVANIQTVKQIASR